MAARCHHPLTTAAIASGPLPPARCVAEDPIYKDSGRSISECMGPCNSCADATKSCPADDALPGACTAYSGDPAVRKCIGARRLA
jgi:hypothetical protein